MSLRNLTQYLKDNLPQLEADLFESEQVGESDIEPVMNFADDFNDVWLLYREYYDGVLYFESWTHPKELIISHIAAWFLEQGGDRDENDLGFPTVEPLVNDDHSVDLIITIRFMECVYVAAHPDGDLTLNGQTMRRVLLNPEVAEGFEFANV